MVFVTVIAPVVGQKAPHAFATVLIRHYKFPNLAQGVLLIVGSSGAPTGTHVRLLQNRKSGFFEGFAENTPIISLLDDTAQGIAVGCCCCVRHSYEVLRTTVRQTSSYITKG